MPKFILRVCRDVLTLTSHFLKPLGPRDGRMVTRSQYQAVALVAFESRVPSQSYASVSRVLLSWRLVAITVAASSALVVHHSTVAATISIPARRAIASLEEKATIPLPIKSGHGIGLMAFLPSGDTVCVIPATGLGSTHTLFVCDLSTRKLEALRGSDSLPYSSLFVSRWRNEFAVAWWFTPYKGDREPRAELETWSVLPLRKCNTFRLDRRFPIPLSPSLSGDVLAYVDQGIVVLYDVVRAREVLRLPQENAAEEASILASEVTFLPNGRYLLMTGSTSARYSAYVVEICSGTVVRRFEMSDDFRGILALSPSGRFMAGSVRASAH